MENCSEGNGMFSSRCLNSEVIRGAPIGNWSENRFSFELSDIGSREEDGS